MYGIVVLVINEVVDVLVKKLVAGVELNIKYSVINFFFIKLR